MCDKDLLAQFLDQQRDAVLRKAEGLPEHLANQRMLTTSTTVAGAVKHLTFVERWWFSGHLGGGPLIAAWADGDSEFEWRVRDDEPLVRLLDQYRCEIERSRDVVAATPDASHGLHSLRWVLLHMIEETARHAGHIDILREMLDGRTGI